MKADYDIEVEWRAFELHPEIPPQGMALPSYIRANFEGMRQNLKQMAQAVGLEIVFSDWMPNSRKALEASEYAREQGQHEQFHQVVFRRFYGEGQDLNSWTMLRAAAEEVGLDPDTMQGETEAGKYQAVVDRQIFEAHANGITAVPAYIFNDKYAILGAQPYQIFQQFMTRLMAEVENNLEEAEIED